MMKVNCSSYCSILHIFLNVFTIIFKRVNSCHALSFDDNTIPASFGDIKQLYELEFTKPVKMEYKLSDQCIHPQPLEKTEVKLASTVFSESTRNAFSWYVDNGYPQWRETLNFLKLISRWWEYLNVNPIGEGVLRLYHS